MSQTAVPDSASGSSVDQSKAFQAASWTGFVALLALSVVDVVRGHWDHDSGYYLERAAFVAEGWRPYLDYASIYPPLFDILHGLPIALGLNRYWLAFAIPIAWNIANAAASAILARSFGFSWTASLLAGSGFLVFSIENGGNHVTLEHGVAFFSLLALNLLNRRGDVSRRTLVFAGIAVMCAAASKQTGVVAFLPVGALLCERRHEFDSRSGVSFLAGLAIPVLLVLTWLGFALGRVYENTIVLLGNYADAYRTEYSLQWEFHRSNPTALFIVFVVVAGIFAIGSGPRRLAAGASLLAAAAAFAPRLIRHYPHYNLNVWPFALLVILLACRSSHEGVSRFSRLAATAILFPSLLLMCSSQSRERWENPSYLTSLFKPAAAVVQELTTEDERVRMYAAEPIVPYLAHRLSDEIDRPASSMSGPWDGSHRLVDPLPEGGPVVVVDQGGEWVAPLRDRLTAAGFGVVFDERVPDGFRVTVFHRTGTPGR